MFFTVSLVSAPITEVKSNSIIDRIMKRWGKKNKLKKFGKRGVGMSQDLDPATYSIKNAYDIIGIEPSWMIDDEYFTDHYFNLLSTLVVGEYDINPVTGGPRSVSSFTKHLEITKRDKEAKKELNIIQKADFHNAKMRFLLHVKYSGDYGTRGQRSIYENKLLEDKAVNTTLIDSLTNYFLKIKNEYGIEYGRTGVFVDLDLSKNERTLNNYVEFLTNLRLELDEDQWLYVKIPANLQKNYVYPLDLVKKIEEIVDRIVIDASGFEKFAPEVPTTVFDKNNDYSVEGTLEYYLQDDPDGERKEKIAVMLPYYGLRYAKNLKTKRVKSSYMTLDNFSKIIGKTGKPSYTKDSLSLIFTIDEAGYKYFYFMDDFVTLNNKFIYLRDSLEINNIAVNALGYYNGQERVPEPWVLLATHFGKQRTTLGWIIAAYLIAFIPIGFVYSCVKYWEVRNALAKYNKFFTRFVMFFIVAVFLYLTAADIIPRGTVGLVIGLIILGIFALYIIMKKVLMRSKKYVNIVR